MHLDTSSLEFKDISIHRLDFSFRDLYFSRHQRPVRKQSQSLILRQASRYSGGRKGRSTKVGSIKKGVGLGFMILQKLIFLRMILVLDPLLPVLVAAEETPTPPTVTLTALRYDAGRNVYLLDFIYSDPPEIGSLQISVTDEKGIEIIRLTAVPLGRNQSVELSARDLDLGQRYVVEVTGFTPGISVAVGYAYADTDRHANTQPNSHTTASSTAAPAVTTRAV